MRSSPLIRISRSSNSPSLVCPDNTARAGLTRSSFPRKKCARRGVRAIDGELDARGAGVDRTRGADRHEAQCSPPKACRAKGLPPVTVLRRGASNPEWNDRHVLGGRLVIMGQ